MGELFGKRCWLASCLVVCFVVCLAFAGVVQAGSIASASSASEMTKPSTEVARNEVAQNGELKKGELSKEAQKNAPIPFKQDGSATGASLGGGALGVLLISLTAIALVWWARKKLNLHSSNTTSSKYLRIVESQRIGPRAVLSVIEFDGSRYLIAQSEHGISCLLPAAATKVTTCAQEAS